MQLTLVNIWIGDREIPKTYRRCMESQRKHYPKADYELINDMKAISLLQAANNLYKGENLVEEYFERPFVTPDYLRCFYLSLKYNCLYLDCDVELSGPLTLDDCPAMERIPATGIYNSGIIWNANRTDIFDDLCSYWFRQRQVQYFYGAMNKVAQDNGFTPIEKGFRHYMIGCFLGYNDRKIFGEEAMPDLPPNGG